MNRKFDTGVEEALNGISQDFKQALINECNSIANFGGFETINFLCLESAMKVIPCILRSCVQSATIGSFGELAGEILNDSFDFSAEKRVTLAIALDIKAKFGDKLPLDIKKRLDDILGNIQGDNLNDESSG